MWPQTGRQLRDGTSREQPVQDWRTDVPIHKTRQTGVGVHRSQGLKSEEARVSAIRMELWAVSAVYSRASVALR